jgi:4-azaleucine resistance transporter AzlC
LPLGFAFGVLATQVGLTVTQSTLMSVLCFTGAGQYIAIGILQAGGAALTIIVANVLVNLRYLLFSTSMVPHLSKVPLGIATLLSYGLTDETYAVAMNHYKNHEATASYMAGLNLTSHLGWILSTLLGAVCGTLITNTDRIGLNFALPAMYTCLLVLVSTRRSDVLVAIFAALVCLVIGYFIPASMLNLSNIIIAAILGATVGVLVNEE